MPNPNGLPRVARDHTRRRFECVLVDPSIPAVADFIRQEVMRGTIRTVPVGVGRLMLVPTGVWPRGPGAQPDCPSVHPAGFGIDGRGRRGP